MYTNALNSPSRLGALVAALGMLLLLLIDGAGVARAAAGAPVRGTLVPARLVHRWSARETARRLTGASYSAGHVRYAIDAYRLVYRTVTPDGRPTIASGLLVVPERATGPLRPVVFDHGTEIYTRDALGSDTSANIDMLQAARRFLAANGTALRSQVVATGFSEGAMAALALGRALQRGAVRGFRPSAIAAVSGPYDIVHAELPALLDGRLNQKDGAIYISFLFVAWNRLHHLYSSPAQVFAAPYDRTIPTLFDGHHPGTQLFAGTPGSPRALLTSRGLEMLRRPTGRFARALAVADSTCDCARVLAARHAPPRVIDLGRPEYQGSRHLGSSVTGIARILDWLRR